MKIKNSFLAVVACVTTLTLAACATTMDKGEDKADKTDKSEKVSSSSDVERDCSTVFETRYVGGKAPTAKEKMKKAAGDVKDAVKGEEEKPVTECKVLELKLDKNTKCELVGSDKIEDLSKVIAENKGNKLVLIAPEQQAKDLVKMAEKFASSKGIDLDQYMNSELFKNLDFPYKGMKCEISDKKVVVWSGKKQVIVTLE